jgi:hypothetical protein
MAFSLNIRLDALISCQRQCCLCHERKHTRMQCHHIIQEADDGPDTFENCIPLCPDCHAEVLAFNPKHPFGGTPYHPEELKRRRDDWYAIVRQRSRDVSINLHRGPQIYPHSKLTHGIASFDYSNNDGFYRLGEGNNEFLTHWTKRSDTTIYCYRDGTNSSIALVPKGCQLQDIDAASLLDFSSRVRSPELNQFVVLENHCGRYAAIKILKIQDDSRGHKTDLLVFDYWILETGSDDFSDSI